MEEVACSVIIVINIFPVRAGFSTSTAVIVRQTDRRRDLLLQHNTGDLLRESLTEQDSTGEGGGAVRRVSFPSIHSHIWHRCRCARRTLVGADCAKRATTGVMACYDSAVYAMQQQQQHQQRTCECNPAKRALNASPSVEETKDQADEASEETRTKNRDPFPSRETEYRSGNRGKRRSIDRPTVEHPEKRRIMTARCETHANFTRPKAASNPNLSQRQRRRSRHHGSAAVFGQRQLRSVCRGTHPIGPIGAAVQSPPATIRRTGESRKKKT